MKTNYSLKNHIPLILFGILALVLGSCGTHNHGYANSDGIYSSEKTAPTTETEEAEEKDVESKEKANYYKQYFKSKESAYADVLEDDESEGAIFTDVEAYHSEESLDEDGYVIVEDRGDEEYGQWGSNSEGITINVYGGNGYGYGYWNRPHWGYGSVWGGSYYNSYWGWGYNYGWGSPFCLGGYYGYGGYYGFYSPYYGYGNHHYGYAYNRGRRNLDYAYGRSSSRGRSSAIAGRRGNYSRSEVNRPSTRPNTRPTTTRPNTRPTTTRPSTRPTTTRRSTSPTRRSSGSVRSSRPSRSSGSRRSSSGRKGRG